MKTVLLSSLIGVFFLTSCSTAYKAGQTPDDVYFSPGRAVGDEEYSNNRNREEYQEYTGSQDDAYLRRKVANRNRWSSIDDFSYWNDCRYSFAPLTFNHFNSFYNCFSCPTFNTWGHPFFPLNGGWGFGGGFGGFGGWNGIGGWNSFGGFGWNNPFFTLINYSSPRFSGGSPSLNALSAARNRTYNNANGFSYFNKQTGTVGNTNRSFGSLMRTVISPSGGGYESGSYSRPSRSFGSSGVGSSSAPSSSAGGFSGGFGSVGSSAGGGRGGRGN
jgi:hypothetical protein